MAVDEIMTTSISGPISTFLGIRMQLESTDKEGVKAWLNMKSDPHSIHQ